MDFLSLLATQKLIFFVATKGKKLQKNDKIGKTEEVKIHTFCETERNVRENKFMMILKEPKKQSFILCLDSTSFEIYSSIIFLRLRRGYIWMKHQY